MVFPATGRANHVELALFSFRAWRSTSSAAATPYRIHNPKPREATPKKRRMISYERSFLRPLFADRFLDLAGVT